MKQLVILVIVFALYSCGNRKAEIVEQIKSAKDSAQLNENWASFYLLLGSEIMENGDPEYSDKRFLKEVPQYIIDNKKWDSAALSKQVQAMIWKEKIDSLELELKKY